MKIDQSIGRRGFATTRLKLIISCAEVPRQSLGQRSVNVPNGTGTSAERTGGSFEQT
jgi:hypothetical protein